MTTHTTHHVTHSPARTDITPVPAARSSRTWAYAGVGAGLAGIGTIVTSSMINGAYDDALRGDVPAQAAKLADQTPQMFAFHTFTLVGAVLLVVFAAGLLRRLRAGVGDVSTVPLVAFAGLVGTAVVSVLGSGLDTEFMMGPQEDGLVDPTNAVLYNHWVGTIPWCWVLAGLAGVAVFVAARAGGAPRWIGRVGLVLGGLTLLLGISPLQYMAGMTGPLWLLVTAIGFSVGDRAFRS
ncbi:hypothetical protein GCM10009795_037380 [Nocardioides hankookensis]|uniref:DUF4386 family protein n=1 Tax=Nocardioides hankookensis TaxID=443157 RepID=A0ABW1LR83_9ACTN